MKLRTLISVIHPRIAVVGHDLAMVWLAWFGANWLRYNVQIAPPEIPLWGAEYWIVLGLQGLILMWTGLYKGLWRFASMPDLVNIARGSVGGVIAISIGLFVYDRLQGTPRSVLVIYPLALMLFLSAPRMLYRFWKDSRTDMGTNKPTLRVLILGAGRAGENLVREIRRENLYRPVGFVDDNRALRGTKIHGVPVIGPIDELPDLAKEVAADMLVIAVPSANNQQMQRIVTLCEASQLPFRTIPRLQDVVEGRSSFNELKEVAIEDLLGRDPVSLDWTAIRTGLAGKRVLVTGGGGSIGAELCRQVARLGCDSLTVLELSEYNLYRIEQELRGEFPELVFNPVLGDCGDSATCERVFSDLRPHAVFHAAAFKHVPLLQGQAREALRNNLCGTQTLAMTADRHGVENFVLISTDKAVNPSSVMGATKRAAEVFCQALSLRSRTHFITVRFGNVLDSAGSVVPLFREQIRRGGPVTVTHPEITRYFMTIPEACQLILQAAVLGRGGEIFALDMGEPVKISYLAEQMILLAGKVPTKEIQIVYTGLRPGEKLFEELFHEQEDYESTGHRKIFLAQSREVPWNELVQLLNRADAAVRRFDEAECLRCLRALVPEFENERIDGAEIVSIHKLTHANP